MKVALLGVDGLSSESVEIDGSIFSDVNLDVVTRAFWAARLIRRSGCAYTKSKCEISGTTAKPHRQKGTGKARQGSKRSPQFRGGAVIFGPKNRNTNIKYNKKLSKSALLSVVSSKFKDNKLFILNSFSFDKTAQIASFLQKSFKGFSCLFVVFRSEFSIMVKLSSNIAKVTVVDVRSLNVFDVLRHNYIIFDKASIQYFEDSL